MLLNCFSKVRLFVSALVTTTVSTTVRVRTVREEVVEAKRRSDVIEADASQNNGASVYWGNALGPCLVLMLLLVQIL